MDKQDKSRLSGADSDRDSSEGATQRHARTRRRLLQSLTLGGAAVTVKALPERWTRPVANAVVLPAHAQATLCTVGCQVGGAASQSSDTLGLSINVQPGTPIGETGATIDEIDNRDRVYFDGITATVGPGCGEPVLDVQLNSADPRFGAPSFSGTASTFDPGTGVATFAEVSVPFNTPFPENLDGPLVTAALTLTFSASGGGSCVIPITFEENTDPGAPGP